MDSRLWILHSPFSILHSPNQDSSSVASLGFSYRSPLWILQTNILDYGFWIMGSRFSIPDSPNQYSGFWILYSGLWLMEHSGILIVGASLKNKPSIKKETCH